MPERMHVPQVGAPDPELRNSPVVEEVTEGPDDGPVDVAVKPQCYFNGKGYRHGEFVCSGSELLRCEHGVWVMEGSCDPDNP
jgi:hypothetical protein